MKRLRFLGIIFIFYSQFMLFAKSKAPATVVDINYDYNNLIAQIKDAKAPYVQDGYAVFTAENTTRFVGIAFEYENFKSVHPFNIKNTRDFEGKISASCKFFVLEIPKDTKKIRYRIVIDGLWTTDPLNLKKDFDSSTQMYFSVLEVPEIFPPQTQVIASDKSDSFTHVDNGSQIVRFVYLGEPGLVVRVGGTFTNWDSWIYIMQEVESGKYILDISLSQGTYFYSYYTGISSFVDNTNPHKGYCPDGSITSIINVKPVAN